MHRFKITATALAVSSALAALTQPLAAMAQEASAETVLVTGTRAKSRTALNTAVPVDVLTQDDLRRAAGAGGDLGSALQALLPSFNFPHQSNSGGADHVRAAQLRGTSPDQVLVLVNGKRRHTSAIVNLEGKTGKGTTPVDFNSIPLGAISRIEVLRDGAGAQYGSDAIGGVINILLDSADNGGEASLLYGTHRTDFKPLDKTLTDGETAELQVKLGSQLANGFLRFGADATTRNATNRAGIGALPFWEADTPANRAFDDKVVLRAGEPEQTNANLWFNAATDLGRGTRGYAFGTYNHRTSTGAAFFRYPDGWENVASIYPNGFRPETTGTNQDLSLVAGAKGMLDGWRYDASVAYGLNDFDYGLRNSLNTSLGAQSPTHFKLGEFRFDQFTGNFDVTKTVDVGATETVLALGGEVRREGYRTRAGDLASYVAGPIVDAPIGAQAGPGLQAGDAVDTSRTILGVYAEASADLGPNFFVDAAARYDHYSDFGDAFTGKLSGRYVLTPQVALRGAVSSNFRAPSLSQDSFSFTVTEWVGGGALGQVRTLPVKHPLARALGAEDLKAEKSRNLSLGITAQPARGVEISLDAYRIDVDDRITLSEKIYGVGAVAAGLGLPGLDTVNFFTNAVDTRTQGADLVVSWTLPLAGGQLRLTETSSYAKTTLRAVRGASSVLAGLGIDANLIGLEEQNTLTSAAPKRRDILTANWRDAVWAITGRATRHGSTTRVFDFGGGFTPTQTYGAVWQLDAEVEYRFNKQWTAAIGGNNITDQYPDRSIDDIAYFGHLPYDIISPIGLNGAFWYAKARYSF